MWLVPFNTNPSKKDIEKFEDSYWVRQLRGYANGWKRIKDANFFIKERTGAYPIWHIEFRNNNMKPQVVLSDSAPIPLSDERIGNNVIRVDSSEPTPAFRDYLKSIPNRTRGFKRSLEIIKGEVDSDGRVNNPKHYSGNKDIQARRNSTNRERS